MLVGERAANMDAVRDHTRSMVLDARSAEQPVLIEAPPNSGKTQTAYELATVSDVPVTYLTGRTDLYEQAQSWCDTETELTCVTIPSPHRDCPSFDEEEPGDTQTVRKLYAKGYSGNAIHYLPRKTAYTPCVSSGCPYLERLQRIDSDIENIDLLIGHHSHARRQWYVRNRLVILDEFNADPFLHSFPDENSGIVDTPGELIGEFLTAAATAETGFPTDIISDVTDILERRVEPSEWAPAHEWFQENGISRSAAEEYDFVTPETNRYDRTHVLAPLLTYCLFRMAPLDNGYERAPPPDQKTPGFWEGTDVSAGTRCVRNRNTGAMHLFLPPDLRSAKQVIGLDGTPTPQLWDLFLPPNTSFDHRVVIDRNALNRYIKGALNMSTVQLADGMNYYAGGTISPHDEYRLAAVREREGQRFPLISTKKALQRYENRGWLNRFVAPASTDQTGEAPPADRSHKVRNFGQIRSSNAFAEESLGVVSGTPFPGDEVVEIWAGLAGIAAEPHETGEEKTFGAAADPIFKHFAHDQVIQAILRFGRSKKIYENQGATVYLNTHAVPEWFDASSSLDIHVKTKESSVIAHLKSVWENADREVHAYRTPTQLLTELTESGLDISNSYLRSVIEDLIDGGILDVRRDAGSHGMDIVRWRPDTPVSSLSSGEQLVFGTENAYFLGEAS